MKKIIFAVTTDLSYDQRMLRTCRTLAAAGYGITIIGRRKPESKHLGHEPYTQKRLRCFFHRGWVFYAEFNTRLFFNLLFSTADAICACDTDTLPAVWLASMLKKTIPVYDSHEYFTQVPELLHRPVTRKFWESIERFIIPKLKHCYTVSKSYARQLEKQYGTKFAVVRNISRLEDIPEPEIWPDLPVPYLIYTGALNEGRGLEEAIEALRHVNCNLLICGDGDIKEKLEKQIRTARLADQVKLAGYIAPERLRRLTAGAMAGLNMLRNDSPSYYYSLANKFFDYMHAGIPQICSNFPEYQVINANRQVALLCELSAASVEDAIRKLLEDPNLKRRLRNNALAMRNEYNWQKEGHALVDVWDKVFYTRGVPEEKLSRKETIK
ncbi:MAG: glycosyltransferase [Bacteroidota bacterium]